MKINFAFVFTATVYLASNGLAGATLPEQYKPAVEDAVLNASTTSRLVADNCANFQGEWVGQCTSRSEVHKAEASKVSIEQAHFSIDEVKSFQCHAKNGPRNPSFVRANRTDKDGRFNVIYFFTFEVKNVYLLYDGSTYRLGSVQLRPAPIFPQETDGRAVNLGISIEGVGNQYRVDGDGSRWFKIGGMGQLHAQVPLDCYVQLYPLKN